MRCPWMRTATVSGVEPIGRLGHQRRRDPMLAALGAVCRPDHGTQGGEMRAFADDLLPGPAVARPQRDIASRGRRRWAEGPAGHLVAHVLRHPFPYRAEVDHRDHVRHRGAVASVHLVPSDHREHGCPAASRYQPGGTCGGADTQPVRPPYWRLRRNRRGG